MSARTLCPEVLLKPVETRREREYILRTFPDTLWTVARNRPRKQSLDFRFTSMTDLATENVRIYFAHGNEIVRPIIEQMLLALDHQVPIVTDKGHELIDAVRRKPPELLIASTHLADMDGIEALIQCGRKQPIPSIIISPSAELEKVEHALQDHVMAYLTEPVELNDLRPSIYLVLRRFREFQELMQENRELKAALDARKWIERAKGQLMKQREIDEDTAYRTLQKMANDSRKKLVEVARIIVEAEDLLKVDGVERTKK